MKQFTEEERAAMWERGRLDEVIRRSQIPRRTQTTRRLEGFTKTPGNEAALATVESFLSGQISPPLLFLYGTPGLGKTRLAIHIAWEYIEAGAGFVLYFQAEDLLNQLQAAQGEGKLFGRMWADLKKAELLILDDIGANNPTEWRWSQLDAIIDFRYREELPTILTANKLDLPDRFLDRVKEGRAVMLKGQSWRGKTNG